jgi:hypothetical protein
MKDAATNNPSDQLMSSQWLDRMLPSDADVPERRLLVAVLVDAVRCLQSSGEKERNEVLAWIRLTHGPARLSFGAMCEGLGFEPEPLARRLRAIAFDVAPVQRVRRARGGRKTTIVEPRAGRRPARPVDQSPPRPTLPVTITA